jgi:hypothetical protein
VRPRGLRGVPTYRQAFLFLRPNRQDRDGSIADRRANPRPELLAKAILIFGPAALLAYLFPVRRASLVTPTHALRVQ